MIFVTKVLPLAKNSVAFTEGKQHLKRGRLTFVKQEDI